MLFSVSGGSFLGVNQSGHEAVHSPQSSAEVENEQSCNFIPPYASMACTGIDLLLYVTLHCKCSITEVNDVTAIIQAYG